MMNYYFAHIRPLIIRWLTIKPTQGTYQVRLARIIIDALIVLMTLRAIILFVGDVQITSPVIVFIPIALMLIASYLTHTKYHQLATILLLVVIFILPYLIAYNQRDGFENIALFLTYGHGSIILAFLFYDARIILLITFAQSISLIVAGNGTLNLTPEEIGIAITSHLILTLLVVVSSLVRQRDQHLIKEQSRASKESQARYQTLFNATFESLIIHDSGRIIDINPATEKLFGYTANDLQGKYLADILTDTLSMRFVEAWSEDELIPYESVGLMQSGDIIPVEVLTKAFTYGGTNVRVSAVRDISYRKRFESELQRQIMLEQLISEISRQFTNIPTDNQQLTYKIQEALEKISQHVYADRSFVLLAFNDGDSPQQPIYEWANAGQDLPIDIEGVLPSTMWAWWRDKLQNGEQIIISDLESLPEDFGTKHNTLQLYGIQSALLLPLQYEDELTGFIGVASTKTQTTWSDANIRILNVISEIFVNAVRRSRAQIARLRSDRQFSKIFHNSPLPVGIAHFPEGKFVNINDSFVEFLGYTPDEIIGKTPLDLHLWDQNPWASNLDMGEAINLETKLQTRSGKVRDVLLALESIDLEGEDSVIIIISDLTDHKQSEARDRAFALEREQVEILNKFISQVSHDFKTPLSTMRTSTYLIDQKLRLDRPVDHHLEVINSQVDQMQRLLEGLLTMSRLDKIETDTFTFDNHDINKLIKEVIIFNQILQKEKQHIVQFEAEPDLPPLPLDDSAIRQAVSNILINAYTYTEQQGTISIRTRRETYDPNYVVIEVEDTGAGVSKEDLPLIFNRFYKSNKARTSGTSGTGLGLPIVRRIVEAHHGKISATSEEGKGSIFRISLPFNHDIARLKMKPDSETVPR